MANVLFRQGTFAQWDALTVKDPLTFFYLVDKEDLYLGEVKISNASDLAAVVGDVAKNAGDIADITATLEKIEGTEEVTDSIRNIVKSYVDPILTTLANKTDRLLESNGNRSLIFNESDGGGAKFEHKDGIMSFTGVNDPEGSDDGIAGQLYVVKKDAETGKNIGTRLNMTRNGFYYLPHSNSAAFGPLDEIATKRDLSGVSGNADAKTIYMVDASAGQTDYAKVWHFYQGADSSDMSNNTLIGTLNFPLDKVLRSSSIVTLTYDDGKLYEDSIDVTEYVKGAGVPANASDAGKYMKFEMQNVDAPMFVNLTDFIDIYTTNNQTSEITLSVDLNNNITGQIGEVSASKILFEVSGGTSTTVQSEIEDIKGGIDDIQTSLTWQTIA